MSAEPSEPVTPHPIFIATAPARALLATLDHALGARAPFLLLTGEAGTGKSALAAEALRRWGDRISLAELPLPAPESTALAATLLELYGGTIKSGAHPFAMLDRLLNVLANATAGGRVAVLLVEDAHMLTKARVLELHRLAAAAAQRQCALELLLVGQPALDAMFDSPELAPLQKRISVRAQLAPLSANDTREYLQQRPNSAGGPSSGLFSRKAARDIHTASHGVLSTIEALAAESTRRAQRASATVVSPEHVRAADHALRAGRPEEVAQAPPPRPVQASTPARITPLPLPLPPRRAEAAPQMDKRPTDQFGSEFPGSEDPRVKDWVARFGGSGVRIGVRSAPRTFRPSELVDDSPAVVTKHVKRPVEEPAPVAEREPVEVEERAPEVHAAPAMEAQPEPVAAASPEPMAEEALVEPAAAAPPEPSSAKTFIINRRSTRRGRVARGSERVPARSAPAKPPVAKPAPVPVRVQPEARPVLASAASAPAARAAFKPPAPSYLVALGIALLALALNEHDALGRLLSHVAVTEQAPITAVAPAPVATAPAPATTLATTRQPHAPAVVEPGGPEYAIAVGSYPTRDMARAECDNLGRLVPMRVHVGPAGGGMRGYRLLVGKFDSSDEAEVAIRRLQARGLIPEAKPVLLPSATSGDAPESAPRPPRASRSTQGRHGSRGRHDRHERRREPVTRGPAIH